MSLFSASGFILQTAKMVTQVITGDTPLKGFLIFNSKCKCISHMAFFRINGYYIF